MNRDPSSTSNRPPPGSLRNPISDNFNADDCYEPGWQLDPAGTLKTGKETQIQLGRQFSAEIWSRKNQNHSKMSFLGIFESFMLTGFEKISVQPGCARLAQTLFQRTPKRGGSAARLRAVAGGKRCPPHPGWVGSPPAGPNHFQRTSLVQNHFQSKTYASSTQHGLPSPKVAICGLSFYF